MSKESYARGFVKAASSAGVDPVCIAKFAQSIANGNINWTKFADALFTTHGKVPDSTKPKPYDTSRVAKNVRHAIDSQPDIIPSVTGKGGNGSWGVQQTARGIDDEIGKALRRIDLVRNGGSVDSGHMSKEEQLAWLNSHFRSLMAARNVIKRSPYAHAGNAYHGAMFINTNDVPGQVSQPVK